MNKLAHHLFFFSFAECDVDTFGPDCTQTCNCATQGCNNMNGTCDVTGCIGGYKGVACNIGKQY